MMKKSNWAVGEAYKMNTAHDPRKRNIHDPDNQYVWADADAEVPAWVWVMRALGVVGFFVGIYMLTLLAFLF
jgi:hypothetical protein